MRFRKLALAAAAGSTLLAAAPAFADPPHWAPAHGWRAKAHAPHFYRAPAYVYYPARPVVIAPPPAYYYYAPPYYYVPPRPAIYGRIPVSPEVAVSFGVRL